MVFPQVDLARLESFFGPKITEPFRTYLRQKVEEQKNVAMSDGGLVVPIQEIADRAAFWEKFNQAYPYFPAGDETRESQQWYRFTLTNGADNTPVFDYETQIVQPDFREVWDYVIQKHPGTQLAETILAMRDLVAAEGWKRTKKVEDFQAKQAAVYSEM
jgi:hypothetical protein